MFVLTEAVRHNLDFDEDILESSVTFVKVGILGHIGIDRFGARLDVARSADESVVEAELDVSLLRADDLTSHVPDAEDFRAVGEEEAVLGLGQPPLGGVECGVVKVGVVRADCFDVVALNCGCQDFADLVEGADFEGAGLDAFEVLRDFIVVVGALHQLGFTIEDIGDDKAIGFVDRA